MVVSPLIGLSRKKGLPGMTSQTGSHWHFVENIEKDKGGAGILPGQVSGMVRIAGGYPFVQMGPMAAMSLLLRRVALAQWGL